MPTIVSTSSGRITGTNLLTFAHTVPSGTNRRLIVFCNVSSAIASLSASFDGTFLTKTNDIDSTPTATGPGRLVVFELANPSAVSSTIGITGSGGAFSLCACAVTLTDCTSVSLLTTAQGSSTTPSVTVSSSVGGLVLDVLGYPLNNVALTVGAGQTSIVEQESIADASRKLAVSSKPGATSVTMSWTMASSGIWILGALTAYSPIPPTSTETTQFLIVM